MNSLKETENKFYTDLENIKKEVKSRLGIELEWEIKILGNR